MAYCHECGSEVAPNDVFCPYCGIFLNPAPAAEEIKEESMIEDLPSKVESEKSEADNLSSLAITEDDVSLDKIFPQNDLPQEIKPPSEIVSGSNKDSELTDTEENVDLKGVSLETDTVNSPISPAADSPFGNNEPAASDAVDYSLEISNEQHSDIEGEMPQDITLPPITESAPYSGDPFQAAKEENHSEFEEAVDRDEKESLFIDNETGIKISEESSAGSSKLPEMGFSDDLGSKPFSQTAPQEFFEEKSIEIEPADNKDPFNETIPDMTASFSSVEDLKVVQSSSEIAREETEMPKETAKPVNDFGSSSVVEIEMPSEQLEEPEISGSQSVFDSVRIMETETDKSEEKNEVPIAGSFIESIAQTPISTDSAAVDNPAQPNENISYTTPNIGGSDTDGKKAKLKPLDEGTLLNNRYEIIRKIGGGGMGAVYLASDNNLGGVLRAVKEMVQSYIEEAQQDKAIADFKRESMILSSLDHPSIPTIYDYFYDDKESRFYLVMKYISGGDLSGRLRSAPEGKLDEKTVTEWAIQVTDVLDYLHKQPNTIVYRDLKPSNVMIDGNSGRVMLIDFGIARSVNKEEKGVTAVGTMGYAPPELFSGNVEPRSDIYSLGSTMFHLLTGADPQSNPLLIFDFQKNPRPRQINSQLSDQMESILMRAVEYNATSRFASAAELKQILEDHLLKLKSGHLTYGVSASPIAVSLQDQPVFCGFCGQKIMATDMFCAFCGSKQPLSQKGVHSEIYSHAPITARLMVIGTNELDAPIFSLDKDENLVGRRDPMSNIFPEVDLSKFDPQTKISRRHARIRRDGSNYLLEDLGSSNGTILIPLINDSTRLLPHQPHILTNGDKIRVGDTTLHFVIK